MDCQVFKERIAEIESRIEFANIQLQNATTIAERKEFLQHIGRLRTTLKRALEALRNCERGLPQPGRYLTTGRITFLRVSSIAEDAFGSRENRLSPAEVVMKLDTQPSRAFGFELKNDDNLPRQEGMLQLLQDALVHRLTVTLDYDQELNNANSKILRVTVVPPKEEIVIGDSLVALLDLNN